jgi:hypothetical protein
MKQTFTVKEMCPECCGTGLYSGMGERDGAAVVCGKCKGTGCYTFVHEYERFSGRKERKGIVRVYRVNSGICIGERPGTCALEDFGGMPYEDWKKGLPFPPKSEDRQHTCPAWYYQSANYSLKPRWWECNMFGRFSNCEHFDNKAKCWRRFDREQGGNHDAPLA